MSTSNISTLEEAISDSGEDWLVNSYNPRDAAMSHLRATLAAVRERARKRLRGSAPDLTERAIVAEYSRNPQKVRAFFQALGGTRTPDMLLMAWRILQGMEIKEIHLDYLRQQTVEMRVVLQSPYGHEDAPYVTQDIHDFGLLRQIGTQEIGGRPVFEGFYPLKLKPYLPLV